MRIVYFTHSLASCWNHGNAHFLRGVLRSLVRRGHSVLACEPARSWSREHLLRDHGPHVVDRVLRMFPMIAHRSYARPEEVDAVVAGADLVIVHEWSEPGLVARLGALRKAGARFLLFFHDTHHRAVSDPAAIEAFDLDGYDAVLAFGEALAAVYRDWGWGDRVYVWHEAADTTLFHPPADQDDDARHGLVWIGNWGDGERSAELEAFLLDPARKAGLPLDIHGVRYPPDALERLAAYGARYHGWIANIDVPATFARHRVTAHVPRRFYVDRLPGIPTIRVFEALACGIPLVSAPWRDSESLFRPGRDFLVADDPDAMTATLRRVTVDRDLRDALVQNGLESIRSRHTCDHRAGELLAVAQALRAPAGQRGAA